MHGAVVRAILKGLKGGGFCCSNALIVVTFVLKPTSVASALGVSGAGL